MPLRALASAFAIALAAACTSGDATPSATAAPPTPEATARPTEATRPPSPSAPSPAATPELPSVGVWVIDSETGEIGVLYEGDVIPRFADALHPTFASSGAVWLADEVGAERHSPVGPVIAVIADAFAVIESGSARERAYFLSGPEGDVTTLVLERPLGMQRTVGVGMIRPVFSPNGASLSYFEHTEAGRFDLVVFDIHLDLRLLRATGIEICQCEDFIGPLWSPSGSYVAYSDFGVASEDDPAENRGSYVVEAFGVTSPRRVAGEPRAIVGWLPSEGGTLVLNGDAGPVLFDAATGVERSLLLDGPELRGEATFAADGRHVQVWTAGGETVLVDPIAGIELARWPVRGRVALTPSGPAVAVEGPATNIAAVAGCNGVWIEHPSLADGECVRGAVHALWSPDGSTLAIVAGTGAQGRTVELRTFSDDPRRVPLPPLAVPVEWSSNGRYLLIVWGIGI